MPPILIDQLAGTIVDDDLVLVELLGEGGMGVAYRGRQKSLNRDVCVKFMRSQNMTDGDWLERFKREANALSKLRTEHIVSVYFVGVWNHAYPYMVMEFLEGVPLGKLLAEGLEWRRVCDLMIQVCDTLHQVHSQGFVHRDLKPDNIFITRRDGAEFVKLLDFGLCSGATAQQLTRTNEILGSVHYMAPECFREPQRTLSVDIYALGCTMFQMLAGVPPFVDESPVAIAYKHANERFPELPETAAEPDVRNVLNGFLRKTCAKKSDERFRTCAEMSAVLRQTVEGGPRNTLLTLLPPTAEPQSRVAPNAGRKFAIILVVLVGLFVTMFALYPVQVKSATARAVDEIQCSLDEMRGGYNALANEAQQSFSRGNYRRAVVFWQRSLKHCDAVTKIQIDLCLARTELLQDNVVAANSLLTDAVELLAQTCTTGGERLPPDRCGELLSTILSLVHSNATEFASPPGSTHSPNTPAGSADTGIRAGESLCARMSRAELHRQTEALERVISSVMLPDLIRIDLIATIAEMYLRACNYSESLKFLCRHSSTATAERLGAISAGTGACEPKQLRRDMEVTVFGPAIPHNDRLVLLLLGLRTFERRILLEDQRNQLERYIFSLVNADAHGEYVPLIRGCLEQHERILEQTCPLVLMTARILTTTTNAEAMVEFQKLRRLTDVPLVALRTIQHLLAKVLLQLDRKQYQQASRDLKECLSLPLWTIVEKRKSEVEDRVLVDISECLHSCNCQIFVALDDPELERELIGREFEWTIALLPKEFAVSSINRMVAQYGSMLLPVTSISEHMDLICKSTLSAKKLRNHEKFTTLGKLFLLLRDCDPRVSGEILRTVAPLLFDDRVYPSSLKLGELRLIEEGLLKVGEVESATILHAHMMKQFGAKSVE